MLAHTRHATLNTVSSKSMVVNVLAYENICIQVGMMKNGIPLSRSSQNGYKQPHDGMSKRQQNQQRKH